MYSQETNPYLDFYEAPRIEARAIPVLAEDKKFIKLLWNDLDIHTGLAKDFVRVQETKQYLDCYGIPRNETLNMVQEFNKFEQSRKSRNFSITDFQAVISLFSELKSGEVYSGETIIRKTSPVFGDSPIVSGMKPDKLYLVTRIQDSITFTQQESN